MTIEQIKADISRKLRKKMEQTEREAEAIMFGEVGGYYGPVPEVYQWTGNLTTTPKTTGVSGGGLSVSMEAYLDTGVTWPTGRYGSNGELVISATNEGHSGTLGNHGYWERSVEQIKAAADAIFSSW